MQPSVASFKLLCSVTCRGHFRVQEPVQLQDHLELAVAALAVRAPWCVRICAIQAWPVTRRPVNRSTKRSALFRERYGAVQNSAEQIDTSFLLDSQ